jgi:hypothetical protein
MAKEVHRSHEDWRKGNGIRLLETEKRQTPVRESITRIMQ